MESISRVAVAFPCYALALALSQRDNVPHRGVLSYQQTGRRSVAFAVFALLTTQPFSGRTLVTNDSDARDDSVGVKSSVGARRTESTTILGGLARSLAAASARASDARAHHTGGSIAAAHDRQTHAHSPSASRPLRLL